MEDSISFYVLLWWKISHCGINTFVPPMHMHEPEIWSVFRGYHLCSLDAFVGWLWYIDHLKGFLKVTVLIPFSRAYVEPTEKGEPSHLLCFKLERIHFFLWGWLEQKCNRRKRINIFQRSIGRYRSHIGIHTFSQQIHSWCGLKRILVIILLPLPVCSHHHRRHHTVAAQHSFLGETMASTNKTMFDTPTKKRMVSCFRRLEKKDYIQSCNITGVRVISVHCIECIRLIVDGFLSSSSLLLLSAVSKTLSVTSMTSRMKKRLILNDDNNHASKKPK